MNWYWRRLRVMSPGEIGWRVRAKTQETVDRWLARTRTSHPGIREIASGNGSALSTHSARLGDQCEWNGRGTPSGRSDAEHHTRIIDRADRLLEHRFDIFDLGDRWLGNEVCWNYEYAADRATPMGFAPGIDYRDYAVTGDAKLVWEPNRHLHLVPLARAFHLTGDRRYAEKVLEQIGGWIDQCPFGHGMNWRSPLELAIRLINWVWALELIQPSQAASKEEMERILSAAYRHLWDITRKYSRYSSANNHLVGEAAGVFIGSTYFPSLKRADRWRRESRDILIREIRAQTHSDGSHVEQAVGYHLFVLQFFLLAGLVARRSGDDLPAEYWDRLESMFAFVATLAEGGDRLPMLGDCDDGYVLDFGSGPPSPGDILTVGAAMFGRADFLGRTPDTRTSVYWLLGQDGLQALDDMNTLAKPKTLESRALAGAGCYLLQSGVENTRISVTFDCGELGFGALAAHGHADALSLTLRACGVDVLVDPGTYDYFTYPKWRDYFRSTRAHNTVVIDDRDQSEMLGAFLWGRKATAECVRWEPNHDGGRVIGRHNGYADLHDPVIHQRDVSLNGTRREVTVRDELHAKQGHKASFYFHFSEQCRVEQLDRHRFRADCGPCLLDIRFDPRLSGHAARGDEEPISGWVSRGYHRKSPTTTLEARCEWKGTLRMDTHMALTPKKP